jgi:chromosome segregation ATPase
MMVQRVFILLLLGLVVAASAAAQSPPSVDIETANMQIEQFGQENRSLVSRIELLEASVERLGSDIETWTGWASGIEKVAALLDRKADELVDALTEIGSRSIVERAQAALERYERIAALLEAKHDELTKRIAESGDLITRHRDNIALYLDRIEQNRTNIALLEAAIAKSRSSESLIETYIEGLDSTLDEASELLEAPKPRSVD